MVQNNMVSVVFGMLDKKQLHTQIKCLLGVITTVMLESSWLVLYLHKYCIWHAMTLALVLHNFCQNKCQWHETTHDMNTNGWHFPKLHHKEWHLCTLACHSLILRSTYDMSKITNYLSRCYICIWNTLEKVSST